MGGGEKLRCFLVNFCIVLLDGCCLYFEEQVLTVRSISSNPMLLKQTLRDEKALHSVNIQWGSAAQCLFLDKIYNGWGSKCSYRSQPNWQSMKRKQLVEAWWSRASLSAPSMFFGLQNSRSQKKESLQYLFHTCKDLLKRRSGNSCFAFPLQFETWSHCCASRAGQSSLGWLRKQQLPCLDSMSPSSSESVCKITCGPLDECLFWSSIRGTGSRSSGCQSHLETWTGFAEGLFSYLMGFILMNLSIHSFPESRHSLLRLHQIQSFQKVKMSPIGALHRNC